MSPAVHIASALLLLSAHVASAQVSTPAVGEYVLNDGTWGTLQVQAGGKFRIESTGANGHVCELGGVIAGGKSRPEGSACQVSFHSDGQKIKVTSNGVDACKDFCGARSWFEGLYQKPPELCVSQKIQAARKQFKKEYQAGNYSVALATIEPVAAQCKPFLYWIQSGWVANDLALTQFKLGDHAGCISTLQGLAPDAALSDGDIRGKFPPADSDMYLPVVRATRTNLKLCRR